MGQDNLVGQKLGNFTVLEYLDEGAMAKVYRARQDRQDRVVALKVVQRLPGDRDDLVVRFQREKTVMEKLNHPHILPIYEYGANTEYLWIASPLIEGGTLGDRLQRGPIPLAEAIEAVRQVADALDWAHHKSVLHRDLKPNNVLIQRTGPLEGRGGESRVHYYLADFGVAKLLEAEGLTTPGMTLGTPAYMSPEQVRGKPLGARSDQYSLAVLAYQLLTGRLPFVGEMVAVMKQHAKSAPPPLGDCVPTHVERVLLHALAKDPDRRFSTCLDFAEALVSAAGLEPAVFAEIVRPAASSVDPLGELPLSSHRQSRRGWVAGAVALMIVAGLGAWAWEKRAPAPKAPVHRSTTSSGTTKRRD